MYTFDEFFNLVVPIAENLNVKRVETMAQYIEGKISYQNLPVVWVLPERGNRNTDGRTQKNTETIVLRVCERNQKQGSGQERKLVNRVEEISHGLIDELQKITQIYDCKVTVNHTGWGNPAIIDKSIFQRDNYFEIVNRGFR